MQDEQLSKNFKRSEFTCHCGCEDDRVRPELIEALQELRNLVNAPIIVTSGFRCIEHNKACGGAKNSQHVYGRAADIHVSGMSQSTLASLAEKIPAFKNGGIGIYKTWVHVDVRPTGKARWNG